MKEKGPFCISVTNIRGITKKFGAKTAEVNDLREKPSSCRRKREKFTANVTPGPDHVISRGLRFAVNVKLNVSIVSSLTLPKLHLATLKHSELG